MKPSNQAKLSYLFGGVATVTGAIISAANGSNIPIVFATATCALLWVIGVQVDLYGSRQTGST